MPSATERETPANAGISGRESGRPSRRTIERRERLPDRLAAQGARATHVATLVPDLTLRKRVGEKTPRTWGVPGTRAT
jgi:hypothetical protein